MEIRRWQRIEGRRWSLILLAGLLDELLAQLAHRLGFGLLGFGGVPDSGKLLPDCLQRRHEQLRGFQPTGLHRGILRARAPGIHLRRGVACVSHDFASSPINSRPYRDCR